MGVSTSDWTVSFWPEDVHSGVEPEWESQPHVLRPMQSQNHVHSGVGASPLGWWGLGEAVALPHFGMDACSRNDYTLHGASG